MYSESEEKSCSSSQSRRRAMFKDATRALEDRDGGKEEEEMDRKKERKREGRKVFCRYHHDDGMAMNGVISRICIRRRVVVLKRRGDSRLETALCRGRRCDNNQPARSPPRLPLLHRTVTPVFKARSDMRACKKEREEGKGRGTFKQTNDTQTWVA